MAEVMPAAFTRRWTIDAPRANERGLLPRRLRVSLVLAAIALVLAGASAGLLAWWKPLQRPAVIVLASAPDGNVSIERGLAMEADCSALAAQISPHGRIIADDVAPTRSELLHCVNMLRLAKGHEHVIVQISSVAGVNAGGKVVLFTSDAGPQHPESATSLNELLSAIAACRAQGVVVLLDLVPANAATLSVVPPVDLAALVDHAIAHADLGNAAIVVSHSPGEQSQLLPATNRSLFSYVIESALAGAADGAADELHDGRVSSDELLAYAEQTLPSLALRTTGQSQRARVYGETHSFDVAVALTKPQPAAKATEYPQWLVDAWARWHAATPWLNDTAVTAWGQSLRRAEVEVMTVSTPDDIAKLRAAIDSHKSPATVGVTDDGLLEQALAQYLVAWRDALEQVPTAQAKPTEQKLIAALLKAQANVSVNNVARSVVNVAVTNEHATIDDWQALLRLMDAWKGLPQSEERSLLKSLVELRVAQAADKNVAEAARLSLLACSELQQAAHDANTWPWLRTLFNQALDARTHGDTLLFARGYASPAAALAAHKQTAEDARQLREAANAIQALMQQQMANRRFVVEHAYLAEQEPALAEAWVQAVTALDQLDRLLRTPEKPLESTAALRALIRDVTSNGAAVDSGLLQLRERLSPGEVVQAIAACQEPDADAHDVTRAGALLRSGVLAPKDRRNLWLAYAPLAHKLLTSPAANQRLVADSGISGAALQSRRIAMNHAWQAYAAGQSIASASHSAADLDLWWRDWQRFRADEIARVLDPDGPPVWSSAALEVIGPFACDALTPSQPQAALALLWQQRRVSGASPIVTALSPSDALTISVQNPRPKIGEAVNLMLRMDASAKGRLAANGFLAIFQCEGRTYHAPISLPGARQTQTVNILLSSSSSQLQLLDRVPLVGGNNASYLWLENNTSDPQQLAVVLGSAPASAPIALAPHEIRHVSLTPPATAAQQSEIAASVQDVATQRTLAQREFAFFAPSAGEVITCKAARIENSSARGCLLTVDLELAATNTAPMTVSLQPIAAKTSRELGVSGGRTRAMLTQQQRTQSLTAKLEALPAGDEVRCEVYVDGIREPLVLSGRFPAYGDLSLLRETRSPQLSIAGHTVSQPVADYSLAIIPTSAANDADIALSLRTADGATVLSRRIAAMSPPVATLTASTPPGGLLVNPIVTPATQAFDTSGLVGRFVWHAEMLAGAAKVASAEMPVIFDSTAPTNCRFVRPMSNGIKANIVEFQVAAWDDLTDIETVQLFIGKPVDGKAPPTARMFPAAKSSGDTSIWNGSVTLPNDLGPCEISAIVTNAAGLSSIVTTPITVLDKLPLAMGEIRGAVLEGSLAQAGLEVKLEKAPGATLKTTKTDENGQFTFSDVTPGSYTVQSTKTTSQRKGSAPVKVEGGETITATIRLAL